MTRHRERVLLFRLQPVKIEKRGNLAEYAVRVQHRRIERKRLFGSGARQRHHLSSRAVVVCGKDDEVSGEGAVRGDESRIQRDGFLELLSCPQHRIGRHFVEIVDALGRSQPTPRHP